ncbi:MAG: tetratricopeptide repeat protein [Planctomycetota bacterium]
MVPTRTRVPRPTVAPERQRASGTPGSTRSLSQRVRSTSSPAELEAARRNASRNLSRPAATIEHGDILSRYRAGNVREAGSDTPTRASQADTNAARVAALRQQAAARSAEARTTAARQSAADPGTSQRIANARAKDVAQRNEARIANARAADVAQRNEARINNARTVAARDAATEQRVQQARSQYAERIAAARRDLQVQNGLTTDVGAVGAGAGTGGVWQTGHDDFSYGASVGYWNQCFWGTWGPCFPYTWGSCFCSPFYCTGLWWNSYWWWGGTWGRPWNCYWLGPFIPAGQSFIVYDNPAPVEPEIVYIEVPVEPEAPLDAPLVDPAFESGPVQLAPQGTDAGLQRELNRAAAYYLTQGDQAFQESRYGDAAHYYAKAVEYSPDSGILYLVLSDALFATGDYRYAAYALRQALSREPSLASNVIDKRDFYAEPAEFERQLAVLELYVEDHVLDMDARLVLSANYLFGGRPADAVDLLENPFSEELRASEEGQLLLDVARTVQFGRPSSGEDRAPAGEREQEF